MEVIAHRGASAYAPENTLAAFDLAIAQGADTIELDVHAGLVVAHDPPAPGQRLLSLDAVLARYGTATRYLVDLKDPRPAWEGEVLSAIDRHGLRDRCTLQSFDAPGLIRLHRLAPGLPYVLLYRRAASAAIDLRAVPSCIAGIGPWHPVVRAHLVARASARGLTLRPWTVDDPAEARRLAGLGVRHLVTNAPDVILDALRGQRRAASTRSVDRPSSSPQNRSRKAA